VYVLALEDGMLHENDAAIAMAAAFCGIGVRPQGRPKEGRVDIVAAEAGLLKVDVTALRQVNLLGEVMCASRHTNTLVARGDIVAGTRAIPLAVEKKIVDKAVDIARRHSGMFLIKPLRRAKAGVLITGNEVFTGLIEDRFEKILRIKIEAVGSCVSAVAFAPDNPDSIAAQIQKLIRGGADLILTTAGMSVDPDDVTRDGIRRAGGDADCYGAPILPGAMFMSAHIDGVPVLGVPACGLFHRTTVFDLVLPRILAGEHLSREEIAGMGHGGLCLNCPECRHPLCPFGK
jgi:molybdopterin biosynthesis enzyme